MADTTRGDDDKKEYFDSPEELKAKVDQLAALIQKSKHFMVFTGAGVSTSTGIPDFRSGMDTKLETGPGVWELRANKKTRSSSHKTTTTLKAIPSLLHMLLVKLQQEDILKCVVSQNTDGLHKRSGLPKKALFELHGNGNLEVCGKCGKEYLRDFRCRMAGRVHDHLTGRKCDNPSCGGNLHDIIINFGESLPEDTLDAGFEHAKLADLCLAMGSSLTVTPAADIPKKVAQRKKNPGSLVIVNLQPTPLDHLAALRIYGKCDDVAKLLASKLAVDIPSFYLRRGLKVEAKSTPKGQRIDVIGTDVEGYPFTYFKQVEFADTSTIESSTKAEPFWLLRKTTAATAALKITLHFWQHYNEPSIDIVFTPKSATSHCSADYLLTYNPVTGQWDGSAPSGDDTLKLIGTAGGDRGPSDSGKPTGATGSNKPKAVTGSGSKPKGPTSTGKLKSPTSGTGKPKGPAGGKKLSGSTGKSHFEVAAATVDDLVSEMSKLS